MLGAPGSPPGPPVWAAGRCPASLFLGVVVVIRTVYRAGDMRAIHVPARHVVPADWLFTIPAVIVQPVTRAMATGGVSARRRAAGLSVAFLTSQGRAGPDDSRRPFKGFRGDIHAPFERLDPLPGCGRPVPAGLDAALQRGPFPARFEPFQECLAHACLAALSVPGTPRHPPFSRLVHRSAIAHLRGFLCRAVGTIGPYVPLRWSRKALLKHRGIDSDMASVSSA